LRVSVAAPTNQGMRRNDILALLNWTLPEVLRIVPNFPKRLTIVGAGDPMWRGGLSGPQSLFIHADRPLISENGTSTLLHEIMHIALGSSADEGMDWIIEGLAEYYSLAILHRSGTISDRRFAAAIRKQAQWGSAVVRLCGSTSSGAITARAVTILSDLDREIRTKSNGRKSLDDVMAALAASEDAISLGDLAAIVRQFAGADADALKPGNLPGCEI
jgi:predicted metalloprotease with PDZ domain